MPKIDLANVEVIRRSSIPSRSTARPRDMRASASATRPD